MESKEIEEFLGYCFDASGHYDLAVALKGVQQAVEYVNLNKGSQYRVLVTGVDDCIVIEAIERTIVFPRTSA
jgi:hypothetical protein